DDVPPCLSPDTATPPPSPLSLHDALPISRLTRLPYPANRIQHPTSEKPGYSGELPLTPARPGAKGPVPPPPPLAPRDRRRQNGPQRVAEARSVAEKPPIGAGGQ